MKQYHISFDNIPQLISELKKITDIHGTDCASKTIINMHWPESSLYKLNDIAAAIETHFPGIAYYGNETSGSIENDCFTMNLTVTVSVFEGESSKVELVWVESGTEMSSLSDLWEYCKNKDNLRAVELIPSLSSLESLDINNTIPPIDENILIFGGASVKYYQPGLPADIIGKGHPLSASGLVAILYFGNEMKFAATSVRGWKGLGKYFTITESEGKVIKTINGEPAYNIYEKYLSLTLEDQDSFVFPLLVEENGIEYIKTPQMILPDKSMQMFTEIPVGTKVRLAYGDKNTILTSIYNESKEIDAFKPQGIKVFSCAGRRYFWGDGEVCRETEVAARIAQTYGFYTGGEIFRFGSILKVMNQTLVFVCVKEEDGQDSSFDRIRLDKSTLDKSLVSRLAFFTEKVTEEQATEQRILKENMDIIGGLATEFQTLFHIDLENGTYRRYSTKNTLFHNRFKSDTSNEYRKLISLLLESDDVHPDFKKGLYDFIFSAKEELKSKKVLNHLIKYRYSDEFLWTKLVIVKCEDVSEEPHFVIFGSTECDAEVKKEQERQEMLKSALAKAQSADRAKTEFLFNMSHDIRTPMNAILGYTDMALRHSDDIEKMLDSLKKIKASGGHLLNLINDILEMSRIEAGKLGIVGKPINIHNAIDGVRSMGTALAIPKSIDFEVNVGELSNPYIIADELHFNEVLINIISNAIKYTQEDGHVVYSIDQIGTPVNGKVLFRFEISDNGIGMSEEFQSRLFEAFSREENPTVAKTEGAGLGLSIVKRIIDLMEGKIFVKSTPGEGSTFVIEMPFAVMSDDEIRRFADVNAVVKPSGKAKMKAKSILLVEDNMMNREIATEILEDAGLYVVTAENGSDAVECIEQNGIDFFDAILMDIQMPIMNGYQATQAIRQLPNGNKIPIIALSANAFEEDRAKSVEAGMNAHVAKPIDIEELFAAIENII